MAYSNEFINNLLVEEIILCNNISKKYNYPDNITHLLYIIVPAFILKYGLTNKNKIEECFDKIPIIIADKQDKIYQAYYFSKLNKDLTTTKGIVLKNYKDIGLMQLVDNLTHEFNHAINSMNNEIKINDYIMIRTGISYNCFDKNSLKFIKKSDNVILEEVINTKQTEIIVDIIKGLSNYQINNTTIQNTLYSIYHSIDSNYKSDGYQLETTVCKNLLNNKTFISTLETLRFKGEIDEIPYFFDNIVGKNNSYQELKNNLNILNKLQNEYNETTFLKKYKLNKIKNTSKKIIEIINKFNENSIYK